MAGSASYQPAGTWHGCTPIGIARCAVFCSSLPRACVSSRLTSAGPSRRVGSTASPWSSYCRSRTCPTLGPSPPPTCPRSTWLRWDRGISGEARRGDGDDESERRGSVKKTIRLAVGAERRLDGQAWQSVSDSGRLCVSNVASRLIGRFAVLAPSFPMAPSARPVPSRRPCEWSS